MPGTIIQELYRILQRQKAAGGSVVWLSPANREALFRPDAAAPSSRPPTAAPMPPMPPRRAGMAAAPPAAAAVRDASASPPRCCAAPGGSGAAPPRPLRSCARTASPGASRTRRRSPT